MKTAYSQPLFVLSLVGIASLCGANDTPSCGFPGINKRKDRGVFVWNDCFSDQWHIRAVAGKQSGVRYQGTLVPTNKKNDTEVNGLFSIESEDSVKLPDFTLDVASRDHDGFDFKLKGPACLTIKTPQDTSLYAGKNRVEVPTSISIPGFQPCDGPLLEYLFDARAREKSTGLKEWKGQFSRPYPISYGFSGYALRFDGRDDNVLIPESTKLRMPKYTMMAWVRSEQTQDKRQTIIEKAAAIWINIQKNGLVRAGGFFGGCTNNNFFRLDSTKPIPRLAWTHVAVTNDRMVMKIYINGELSGEEKLPTRKPYCANQGPLNFGSDYRGTNGKDSEMHFKGMMDTVRVYDKALSEDEIRSEMFRN